MTIVRDYVAVARLRSREVFIPLSHKPGHAQVDFGEADGIIGGKLTRFHYFCMDLPHSDAPFFKTYPAEVAEAFCDGHVEAFAFFGGVPRSILYDNTKLAVARIRYSRFPDADDILASIEAFCVQRLAPF